jgi:RHS repeat-associated protein
VIAEYENGAGVNSPTREYIYSWGLWVAKIEGASVEYQISDHLSVRVIADANGNKVGERGHYPFGGTWYETGTNTKFKFTSYEREAGTGSAGDLDYAVYRSHYPRLGRFTSPDPVAGSVIDPQSLNRYAYVRNDPINLTDPSGLDPVVPFICGEWVCIPTSPGSGGGGGGGGGESGPWSPFGNSVYDYLFDPANGLGIISDLGGWMANATTRNGMGYEWYNLPGNWSVAAEEERHVSIITTGWDPELKCLRGVTCGGRSEGGGSGGGGGKDAIEEAIEKAKGMLSDKDCADFLKGLLSNLGLPPDLDQFLGNFNSLTIVPTPQGDRGPGYRTTAHAHYGTWTIHVDASGARDLVPTLLHDTFHTIYYGFTDYQMAVAINGSGVRPGPKTSQKKADRLNSRAVSSAFNAHCTP